MIKNTSHFRNSQSFAHFGFYIFGITLIAILLLSFATLPLIAAGANYQESMKKAESATDYYQARENVYEQLADINQILIGAYITAQNPSEYYLLAKSQLSTFENGIFEGTNSLYTYTFTEKISDTESFSVILEIHYPKQDTESFYSIVDWQIK